MMGHSNRMSFFPGNPHVRFQGFMLAVLVGQVGVGIGLKVTKGFDDGERGVLMFVYLLEIRFLRRFY